MKQTIFQVILLLFLAFMCLSGLLLVRHVLELPFRSTNDVLHEKDSALNLDVISVLGFTLFYSTLVVLGNLAADILYAFLDPRVRYT